MQKDLIELLEIFLNDLSLNTVKAIGLKYYQQERNKIVINNRVHSSTKLTPIQASLKKNEGYVYNNLLDKRKRVYPKFQVNNLYRVADLKKTFSKGDTTNWSYKF